MLLKVHGYDRVSTRRTDLGQSQIFSRGRPLAARSRPHHGVRQASPIIQPESNLAADEPDPIDGKRTTQAPKDRSDRNWVAGWAIGISLACDNGRLNDCRDWRAQFFQFPRASSKV